MSSVSSETVGDSAYQPSGTHRQVLASLKRRYAAERRFKMYGLISIILGLLFLSLLFVSILANGYSAFVQTYIRLDIHFDEQVLDPEGKREASVLSSANYQVLIKNALKPEFPDAASRRERRMLNRMVSSGAAFELREMVLRDPSLIGSEKSLWLPADDDTDLFMKGGVDRNTDESQRRVKDKHIAWIDGLIKENKIEKRFNFNFFINGDSREPELAGIGGAIVGSFFTLIVTLLLSFPIGVATAIYLEEFAPVNKWTDLIEVNINNLAAVPSIIFGLLGLAIFLNFF